MSACERPAVARPIDKLDIKDTKCVRHPTVLTGTQSVPKKNVFFLQMYGSRAILVL